MFVLLFFDIFHSLHFVISTPAKSSEGSGSNCVVYTSACVCFRGFGLGFATCSISGSTTGSTTGSITGSTAGSATGSATGSSTGSTTGSATFLVGPLL